MNESKQDPRAQLAEYMKQQPESTQTTHKWMNRLTAASAGIAAGFFIWAVYVSINSTKVYLLKVPYWWMVWMASMALPFFLAGLTAVIVQAFPPITPHLTSVPFTTGRQAARWGVFTMVGVPAMAAFWVAIIYSMVGNIGRLQTFITVIVTVSAVSVVSALSSVFARIFRSR